MNEYIELNIQIDGQQLSVREDIPALLRCSSGRMSCTSAMAGSLERMAQRMGELLERERKHGFVRWES